MSGKSTEQTAEWELGWTMEADGGNALFKSGEIRWESDFDDDLSFIIEELAGSVPVQLHLDNDETHCGVLANMTPDRARTLGEVLIDAANKVEDYK